jgi:hypothetical protein
MTSPAITIARPFAEQTKRETAYLVSDLAVGVIAFSVFISLLATGASLAITLVGLPLLAGTVLLARSAAGLERRRASALLGVPFAVPAPRPTADTLTAKVLSPLRDKTGWRAVAYAILMLPAGTFTFCAAVVWWATTAFLVTLPAWAWALAHNGPRLEDGSYWSAPWELAASTAAGLLLLAATPYVIHAITRVDRALLRLIDAR